MVKIADSFSGYLNVGDDTFAYTISDYSVTLIPAESELSNAYKAIDRICKRDEELWEDDRNISEYIFGLDNSCRIAVLRRGAFSKGFWGTNPTIRFATPIIIKSAGNTDYFYQNLSQDWDKFHAITFYGGNINSLYSPEMAIEHPKDENRKHDGSGEVRIRSWDDFTRSLDFEINGEKATLTVSISRTWTADNKERIGAYSLGELNSFIRFSFDNAQGFDRIEKYYEVAKTLIAILTKQNNVSFDVYLSQRDSKKQLRKTAICKINDGCVNYCTKRPHEVIPIYSVFDCLPRLIDIIACDGIRSLSVLLPEDNRDAHRITITNVQNLCSALEVAYDWSKRHKEKDALMKELKRRIEKTISEFIEVHSEINVNKQTTIRSAFKYLNYTLSQRILTIYNENSEVVDAIVSKWSLPQVDESSIDAFVKLRNNSTHTGAFVWDESAQLYTPLLALVYSCLLRYLGMPDEEIKPVLLQVF